MTHPAASLIQDKIDELNALLQKANNTGLSVELRVHEVRQLGLYTSWQLTARYFMPVTPTKETPRAEPG